MTDIWNASAQASLDNHLNTQVHESVLSACSVGMMLIVPLLLFEKYVVFPPGSPGLRPSLWAVAWLFVLVLGTYVVLRRCGPTRYSYLGIYCISLAATASISVITVQLLPVLGAVCLGVLIVVLASSLATWEARHPLAITLLSAIIYVAINLPATADPVLQRTIRINGVLIGFMGALAAVSARLRLAAVVREFKARHALSETNRLLDSRDRALQADLEQAHTFQQRLMPANPSNASSQWEIIYRPADVLGGDWYDIVLLGNDRWRVLTVDIAGHGVQACLRSMLLKSEYDRLARSAVPPWELLAQLNDAFIARYGDEAILYAACCTELWRDQDVWRVSHSNAGQPALLQVHAGQPTWVEDSSAVQGAFAGLEYLRYEATLSRGDRLFWLTDGLIEERMGPGLSTEAAVRRSLTVPGQDLRAACAAALACTLDASKQHPADDITLIGAQLH